MLPSGDHVAAQRHLVTMGLWLVPLLLVGGGARRHEAGAGELGQLGQQIHPNHHRHHEHDIHIAGFFPTSPGYAETSIGQSVRT